jgi:hypothetical protein
VVVSISARDNETIRNGTTAVNSAGEGGRNSGVNQAPERRAMIVSTSRWQRARWVTSTWPYDVDGT